MSPRFAAWRRDYGLQVVVLAGLWIYFAWSTPLFRGTSSVYSVLAGFALLGLVSLGMGVTVFVGGFDFSVSSVAAFAGAIAIKSAGAGLIPTLLLATLVGVAIGAAQGLLIHRLAVDSLVFTIGTLIVLRGLAYVLTNNVTEPLKDFAVSNALLKRWGFLSPDILVAAAIFLLIWLFLAFTRPGRELYAVGGGKREVQAAGVSVSRAVVLAFAISGGCAALAGALASVKGGSASPSAFSDVLLNAPAAILIGGISLQGGRGTVLNVVFGVAILSVLTAGLGIRGESASVVSLSVGSLLIAVVIAQLVLAKLAERARQRRRADLAWAARQPAVAQ